MNVQNAKSFRYQFLKYQRRCGINFFLTIRRSRPLTAAAELRALGHSGGEMVTLNKERSLDGIGGWLILVVLGLLLSPIRIVTLLSQYHVPMFSDGTWELLTTPSSDFFHPFWAPLIAFEIAGNLLILLLGLLTLYFLFRKSKYTPRFAIAWLLTSFIFVIADYFLADTIPLIAAQPADPETIKEVARSTVGAAIWVPYFLVSKRVKATFTR